MSAFRARYEGLTARGALPSMAAMGVSVRTVILGLILGLPGPPGAPVD